MGGDQCIGRFSRCKQREWRLSCRHDNCGYEHHAVVAKLKTPEEQKHWLTIAAEQKLSKRRLRVSVHKRRLVSVEELQQADTDHGRPTYMTWLNKLLQWWRNRIKDDPIDQWDPLDRARLKRDLEPWVKIYEQL